MKGFDFEKSTEDGQIDSGKNKSSRAHIVDNAEFMRAHLMQVARRSSKQEQKSKDSLKRRKARFKETTVKGGIIKASQDFHRASPKLIHGVPDGTYIYRSRKRNAFKMRYRKGYEGRIREINEYKPQGLAHNEIRGNHHTYQDNNQTISSVYHAQPRTAVEKDSRREMPHNLIHMNGESAVRGHNIPLVETAPSIDVGKENSNRSEDNYSAEYPYWGKQIRRRIEKIANDNGYTVRQYNECRFVGKSATI